MTKGKQRNKNKRQNMPEKSVVSDSKWETSSEISNYDGASIISNAHSDPQSLFELNPNVDAPEVDEISAQEDLEFKIIEAIDGCTQKSLKGRQTCIDSVRKALCSNYLFEFISQRKITICDAIERSLKKGKCGEQSSAAKLASALLLVLAVDEDEYSEVQSSLYPVLMTILNDPSMNSGSRSECAVTLGLFMFLNSMEDECIFSTMTALQNIFSASFLKGDGSVPIHAPNVTSLHTAALTSWCLILTAFVSNKVHQMTETSVLKRMPELLQSSDVDLRIAAGEAIALIHEMAREHDEEFEMEDSEDLYDNLKQLATDSNKYRAKKDRCQQRSSFREILKSVQDFEDPELEVTYGEEILTITTWCERRQYYSFCYILGSGMNLQLAKNEFIRDLFHLGPPITDFDKKKPKKFERHMARSAAFKARTQGLRKLRDKRVAELI